MKFTAKMMLSTLLASTVALSQPEPGNEGGAGGHGLELNEKLYLMDLIEAGVETNPHLETSEQGTPKFDRVAAEVATHLELLGEGYDKETEAAVVNKLIELHKYDSLLALTIVDAINRLNWYTVSKELIEVWLPQPIVKGRYVQIAVRRDLNVRIARENFLRLDPANRAALIFHEVLYAMAPLKSFKFEGESGYYYQVGSHVRDLVGVLFSRRIKVFDIEKVASKIFSRHSRGAAITRVSDDSTDFIYAFYLSLDSRAVSGSNAYCYSNELGNSWSISINETPEKTAENLCKKWEENANCDYHIQIAGYTGSQSVLTYRTVERNLPIHRSRVGLNDKLSYFKIADGKSGRVVTKADCIAAVTDLTKKSQAYLSQFDSIFK